MARLSPPARRKFAGIRQIPVVHFHSHPRDYTGLVLFRIFLPFSFLGGAPSSVRVRIVGLAVRPRLSAQQKSHPADSVASLISAPFGDILLPSAAAAARGSGRPSNKYSTPAHLSPPRLVPFDPYVRRVASSPGDPTIPRRPTKEIIPVDARPPTPSRHHNHPG